MHFVAPWRFAAGLALLLITILAGCNPPPAPPVITPAGPISIEPGKTLIVNASSPGAVAYKWTLDGSGSIPPDTTAGTILYTASGDEGAMAVLSVVGVANLRVNKVFDMSFIIREQLLVELPAVEGKYEQFQSALQRIRTTRKAARFASQASQVVTQL